MNTINIAQQKEAKKRLINILRRKGTIITGVDMNRQLTEYSDQNGLTHALGATTKFSIQLAYEKFKESEI